MSAMRYSRRGCSSDVYIEEDVALITVTIAEKELAG